MKSGSNTILTYVLAVLVLAGVYFDLRAIFSERQIRSLRTEVAVRQLEMNRLSLLLNEAMVYGKTHPDINRILKPFEAKPSARRSS